MNQKIEHNFFKIVCINVGLIIAGVCLIISSMMFDVENHSLAKIMPEFFFGISVYAFWKVNSCLLNGRLLVKVLVSLMATVCEFLLIIFLLHLIWK